MSPTAPQIGFDRFIQLDWVAAALKVRAGLANLDELNDLLDAAGLGLAARKKTRTVLNRLWLEPRVDLVDFANRGAEIFKANPGVSVAALAWGMAIATYPFFGRVAELVGRLSALQGDCSSAEVHRRMSEIYGEREGIYRMSNMVLQSQAGWGAIERVEKGKRLVRCPPITVTENVPLIVPPVSRKQKGQSEDWPNCLNPLVRPERFERPTPWFVAKYSIQLSYGRLALLKRRIIQRRSAVLKHYLANFRVRGGFPRRAARLPCGEAECENAGLLIQRAPDDLAYIRRQAID
jgi:hypothetical protein